MLHTSEKTHNAIALFNKWNEAVVEDYNKVKGDISITRSDSQRSIFEGKGGSLPIFGKNSHTDDIELFPSVFNLINELDSDPNIQTTSVCAAIYQSKGRSNLHTDFDNEFSVWKMPGKLFNRKVRRYIAHMAIIIPDNCHFYHFDKTITKINWKLNESFMFEMYDKHWSVNNSDSTRVICMYTFIEAV